MGDRGQYPHLPEEVSIWDEGSSRAGHAHVSHIPEWAPPSSAAFSQAASQPLLQHGAPQHSNAYPANSDHHRVPQQPAKGIYEEAAVPPPASHLPHPRHGLQLPPQVSAGPPPPQLPLAMSLPQAHHSVSPHLSLQVTCYATPHSSSMMPVADRHCYFAAHACHAYTIRPRYNNGIGPRV